MSYRKVEYMGSIMKKRGNDWLGNVRVVVNDKKTPMNSGSVTVSYKPQVMSVSDYYSFGSEIAERSYDFSLQYRFGFQRQEKDNEIYGKGNAYYFKFREHDARIGRFWSVDPLDAKYPYWTPYQFSGNRVIDMMELEGAEPKEAGKEIGEQREAPQQGQEDKGNKLWGWDGKQWGYALPEVKIKPADIMISKNVDSYTISEKSKSILRYIMRKADIKKIVITSSIRTPQKQAEIMFKNIEKYGIEYNKSLYSKAGDEIISIYEKGKLNRLSNSDIIQMMTNKIQMLGTAVSKHVGDYKKLNVLDIDPASIEKHKHILFQNLLFTTPEINKVLSPYTTPKDPAFHIEIPQ